jgi:hypothetical protein
MSRFSPTVRPEVPAPLDFRGLSDSLRSVREERRQRQLDDERREEQRVRLEEITLDRAVRTRDEERAGRREQADREARRADLIAKNWLPSSARTPDAPDVTRGPEDQVVETDIEGEKFFLDPLAVRRRAAKDEEAQYGARRTGEKTATYEAAVGVGVSPEDARRYAFGPAGLTFNERSTLTQQQQSYAFGKRIELMRQQHSNNLALIGARRRGDIEGGKRAAQLLELSRQEMADQDRLWQINERTIPDDPYDLRRQLQDPNTAAQVQAAIDWVKNYTSVERPKLQAGIDAARDAIVGGGKPPAAAGGLRPVTQAWWDSTLATLTSRMGAQAAAAYMAKNYTVR